MKAIARRTSTGSFTHRIDIREHQLVADEPPDLGGDDEGPTPKELLAASVASCVAVTIEMYARRKGWEIGLVEIACDYEIPERGSPTEFRVVIRLPSTCTEEQAEHLRAIAGKCPVHRTLEGDVVFDERVELVAPAGG